MDDLGKYAAQSPVYMWTSGAVDMWITVPVQSPCKAHGLSLAGHVGGERVHRRVAGLADDPGGRGLGPRLVPAGDADAGAQRGQAGGGRPADAASAAVTSAVLPAIGPRKFSVIGGGPFV